MSYSIALFDADNTLLDFSRSERDALSECLLARGIEPTEQILSRYAEINDLHLQIFRHQKYPYSHILSDIHQHHSDVEKLFDVMMSYQNAQIDSESNVRSKWYTNGNSEVALAFHIDDRDHLGVYKLNLYLERAVTEKSG